MKALVKAKPETGLWMQDWGFEITESIRIGATGPECLSNVPRKMFVKD